MITDGRDERGRFAPGNGGGPGRKPLATERRYLETLGKACSPEDFHEICVRAVEDAKNGDHRAREWLGRYLVADRQIEELEEGVQFHVYLPEVAQLDEDGHVIPAAAAKPADNRP